MRIERHLALVVEDNAEDAEHAAAVCASLGFRVMVARTQEEAERLMTEHRFCLLVLDLDLPMNERTGTRIETGMNVLRGFRIRFGRDDAAVVVNSAYGQSSENVVQALKLGANDFSQKGERGRRSLDDRILDALKETCEARHARCPNVQVHRALAAPTVQPLVERPRELTGQPEGAHRLHFTGACRHRRYQLILDGREVWLRKETILVVGRLARQLQDAASDGWVHWKAEGLSHHSATVGRAVRDLRERAGVDDLIVRDGEGSARLNCAPADVTFDVQSMRTSFSELVDAVSGAA